MEAEEYRKVASATRIQRNWKRWKTPFRSVQEKAQLEGQTLSSA